MIRYNGGAIGEFIGDAIRNLWSKFTTYVFRGNSSLIIPNGGIFYINKLPMTVAGIEYVAGVSNAMDEIIFDASRNVPTSTENRPASISSCIVITY
jgi:hypothetical protein